MTESTVAPIGGIQALDLDPIRPHDRSHHELGNSIPTPDFEVGRPRVHQDHLNLSAIVCVDRTRCVGDEYAMPKRQSAARTHLCLETHGQRNAPACGNQPPFSWGKLNGLCQSRAQIESCRPLSRCLRKRQVLCVRVPGNFDPKPRRLFASVPLAQGAGLPTRPARLRPPGRRALPCARDEFDRRGRCRCTSRAPRLPLRGHR